MKYVRAATAASGNEQLLERMLDKDILTKNIRVFFVHTMKVNGVQCFFF